MILAFLSSLALERALELAVALKLTLAGAPTESAT
jgi:hypothetical protein